MVQLAGTWKPSELLDNGTVSLNEQGRGLRRSGIERESWQLSQQLWNARSTCERVLLLQCLVTGDSRETCVKRGVLWISVLDLLSLSLDLGVRHDL